MAFGHWNVNSSGNPSSRRNKTASFSASTLMTSGADGTIITMDVDAPSQLSNNTQYAYGILDTVQDGLYGMTGADNIPGANNKLIYSRTGVAQPPTDPNGYSSSSYEGHLAVWGIYESNTEPNQPGTVTVEGTTSLVQASPATIGTLTPIIEGLFRDPNEVVGSFAIGQADKLKRLQYQIIKDSDGTIHFDSGVLSATAGEQTARNFSRVYSGTALVPGTEYRVRVKVWDLFDASSIWSAYRYFLVAAGSMDTAAGAPSGKQETNAPGPFVAVWRHTGALSTNAVQVRIRDADTGATLRDSGLITKTVAPNASSSVTWATTAFTNLPYDGNNLIWEMRGRDTGNNWGSWGAQSFSVDAAPSVPALQAPANGIVTTSQPLLSATVTDLDDDSTTGLLVKFRIKDNAGTLLFTRSGTYNSGNGRWEYQTTGSDLATFATYRWDAYSFDGTVYSGATTVEASSTKSAERTIVYALGPIPTITAPADLSTITTATPTITWTVAGTQTKRRIKVTLVAGSIVLHDTGDVVSAVTSYTLPATLTSGMPLHNGNVIDVTVTITDSAPLSGSDINRATLTYTDPASLAVSVTEERAPGDITPSRVVARWPATAYSLGTFLYYRLSRRPTDEALAADPTLDPHTVYFAKISSASQNLYEDNGARAGVEYLYSLTQYIQQGVDVLRSVHTESIITVHFNATIIHSVRDPSQRIVLAARDDRTITPIDDVAVLMPWNQQKPVHLHGETFYREIDAEFKILTATPVDATNLIRRALAMAQFGGPLHYRDGRGNSFFGEFASPPIEVDPKGGGVRRLRIRFRELAWDESVTDIEP